MILSVRLSVLSLAAKMRGKARQSESENGAWMGRKEEEEGDGHYQGGAKGDMELGRMSGRR